MRSIVSLFLLCLGVGAFAAAGGFLVGASNSPVVGAFLTATFGLIAGGLGALATMKGGQRRGGTSDAMGIVGCLLLIFSVSLIGGVIRGAEVRASGWPNSKAIAQVKNFPWNPEQVPRDARAALDWIAVQEQLVTLGYSENQVEQLYAKVGISQKGEEGGLLFVQSPLLSSVLNELFASEPPGRPTVPTIADTWKGSPSPRDNGKS